MMAHGRQIPTRSPNKSIRAFSDLALSQDENFLRCNFVGEDPWKMSRRERKSSQLEQLAPGEHRND